MGWGYGCGSSRLCGGGFLFIIFFRGRRKDLRKVLRKVLFKVPLTTPLTKFHKFLHPLPLRVRLRDSLDALALRNHVSQDKYWLCACGVRVYRYL